MLTCECDVGTSGIRQLKKRGKGEERNRKGGERQKEEILSIDLVLETC